MFDGDYDLYTVRHIIVTGISILVIFVLIVGIYSIAKSLMIKSTEELNQVVAELEQEQVNTSTELVVKPENNVTVENVQIETDKVINTNTYIDNSQSIINEAQHNSYVLPVTLGLIFAFIIIIFEKWLKHKKEKDERTERILSTPLQTYEQTEADALKDKYKSIE